MTKDCIKFIINSIPHKKHDKYLYALSLFIKFYKSLLRYVRFQVLTVVTIMFLSSDL